MNKTLGLISLSALASLLAVPSQALELSEAELEALRAHWAACHYQQELPETVEEMLAVHSHFWDEAGLPSADDHFDLYIQAISAIDCPADEPVGHE